MKTISIEFTPNEAQATAKALQRELFWAIRCRDLTAAGTNGNPERAAEWNATIETLKRMTERLRIAAEGQP